MPDEGVAPRAWGPSFASIVLAGALFVPQVVGGFYSGIGRQEPAGFRTLTTLALFMSVVAWFWNYCRVNRVAWQFDMGWFLMFGWFVIVPYYILSREGGRGLLRVGLFLLTYGAAVASGWATAIWTRLLFGR